MADMFKRLSWDDLRVVKAIGEAGSIAGAAATMGVNHTTIFRRLAQVEYVLHVSLFERRRQGYTPTSAGSEVIALVQRLELDIVAVAQGLAGPDQILTGELRVTTSDSIGSHLLMPISAQFRALHPSLRIEVLIGNDPFNLARGDADIALRATNAPPENLIGRKLATVAWAPYGRAADHGDKRIDAQALHRRTWISYNQDLASLKAAAWIEEYVAQQDIALRTNSVQGVATAIAAGVGVGYLPCMLGDLTGSLVRIGPVEPGFSDALWLLTHPGLRASRRVQVFIEHCARMIAMQRSVIEGEGGLPLSSSEKGFIDQLQAVG
jgi:DNA-binding transcriptional LysR family regulator